MEMEAITSAQACFWQAPKGEEENRDGEAWLGPYRKRDVEVARTLIDGIAPVSLRMPFTAAVERLGEAHRKLLHAALEPELAPCHGHSTYMVCSRQSATCTVVSRRSALLCGTPTQTLIWWFSGGCGPARRLRERFKKTGGQDYHPNQIARSLKTQRTHTVGMVVPISQIRVSRPLSAAPRWRVKCMDTPSSCATLTKSQSRNGDNSELVVASSGR